VNLILDLFCALNIVLFCLVLFYFHLRAFVFLDTVFSFSDLRSEFANLWFGLSPKFRVQIKVYAQSFCSAKD